MQKDSIKEGITNFNKIPRKNDKWQMSKDLAGNNLDKIWKGNCSVKKKKESAFPIIHMVTLNAKMGSKTKRLSPQNSPTF